MGEKSAQKKEYIVETARKVFIEKGYKNVTMKDIVEACEISRGGLYLYFESTSDIFKEVLAAEAITENKEELKLAAKVSPSDIFALFLKEQKKSVLKKKDNLSVAIYEYYFENKNGKKDNYLNRQFSTGVKVIEKLIEACVSNGEFYCEDAAGVARNIMYVIEGMKIQSQTVGITEAAVDQEFMHILSGLAIEE